MVEQAPVNPEVCVTPNATPVEGDTQATVPPILSVAASEDELPMSPAPGSETEVAQQLNAIAPAAGAVPSAAAPVDEEPASNKPEVCEVPAALKGEPVDAAVASAAVQIVKPAAGETRHYQVADNQNYNLDFDIKQAVVASEGNTIVIRFADGAVIFLDEFTDHAGAGTKLIVDNCAAVGAPDLMQMAGLAGQLAEIAPAAGPAAGAAPAAAGPQGNTAPGNSGAGFAPFTIGGLPGVPDALGALGPTALAYRVPENVRREPISGAQSDSKPGGFTAGTPLNVVDETGGGGSAGDFSTPRTSGGSISFDYGADGAGNVRIIDGPSGLTHHGDPVSISISADGLTATGSTASGDVVFVFTLDPATGAYTFTQDASLDHPIPGDFDEPLDLPFVIRVTDSDGDFVDGTAVIRVLDDGPVAAVADGSVGTVDETGSVLAAAGTISFNYGGDGAGSVRFASGPAGLTSHGSAVSIDVNDTVVIGKLPDGSVVFTLALDPATGAWHYSQALPLDHPDSSNPDDVLSLGFSVRITDYDGDSLETPITVNVHDDGPSAGTVSLILDSGSAAVSGTLPFAYGADGAGQVELSGAVPTGLSVGGQAVVVTQTGSGAVGKLADGTAVFSFTVDAAGHYAYTQHLALDGTPVLHLGYKAVDFDGDVATGTITIDTGDGKPCVGTATQNTTTVDETGGFDTVSGALAFSFGPDGAGSVSVTSGPTGLTSQGQAVTVTVSAEGAVGKLADGTVAFTLTVNPATGAYSFSQKAPLDHPNAGNPDDALTLGFGFTVRDADGDPANGQLTVVVRDDGPSAGAVSFATEAGAAAVSGTLPFAYGADGAGQVELSGAVPTGLSVGGQAVVVTQTGSGAVGKLADGTAVFSFTVDAAGHYAYTQHLALDGTPVLHLGYKAVDFDGDVATGTITIDTGDGKPCVGTATQNTTTVDETGGFDTVSGALAFSFGPDGAGSVSVTSGPTGLTSQGQAVTVTVSAEGAVGKLADGTVAFTLTVNPATGAYSFSQKAPLDHPNAGNPDDALTLGFGFTVRDADGDPANGQLTVVVRDDGPSAGAVSFATEAGAAAVSGTLPFAYGADGAGQVELSGAVPTGLSVGGQAVVVTQTGSGAVGKLADGTVAFSFTVDAAGHYAYTQHLALDGTPVLHLGYKAVDFDGDVATGTITIDTGDGKPCVGTATQNTTTVDETGGFDTVSGALAFSFGPDGAGSVNVTSGPVGLTSQGQAVTVTVSAEGAVGKLADGTVAFTLTVNPATGAYSFSQKAPLDHPNAGNPDDALTLGFGFTVRDADGDPASGQLTVVVRDDGPSAGAVSFATESGSAAVSGTLPFAYGADGAGQVELSGAVPTGLSVGGQAVVVTQTGSGAVGKLADGTAVFSFTVDAAGHYAYTQHLALDGTPVLHLGYKAVDFDGDVATGTITIDTGDGKPCVGQGGENVATVDETGGFDTVSGTLAFSFGPDGAGSVNVTSGPVGLTSQGQAVTVTVSAEGAVGKLADGTVAFTLTVNPATGAYSFSQKAPLDHPNAGNPDDALTLGFGFTVRDADGDPASGQLTVVVRDDGPSAGAVSFATESGSAAVSGTLPFAYGADGAGQVELSGAVPTGLSVGGQAVVVTQTGSGAVGKLADGTAVFSFTVDAAGHYAYTQHLALDGTPVLHLGYKAVDFDGDVATGTITIDTGDGKPCVGTATQNTTTVDETGGFDTVSGALAFSFGPDGAGSVSVTSGPTGLTSQGQAVTVTVSAEGAVGKLADGTVVFTLTVNPATGAYSFSQKAPLDHPNAGNPDDALTLGFGFTVRDADGDPASGQLTVVVRDDGPSAGAVSFATESGSAAVSGTLPFAYGADGAGQVELSGAVPTGLSVGGQAVVVTQTGSGAVGKLADGTAVFSFTVDAAGHYAYTQHLALDGTPVLHLGYKAVDFDGDVATGTITIDTGDGKPCVGQGGENVATVDETGGFDTVSGTLAFSFGPDGAGSVNVTSGPVGLTSQGQAVTVTVSAEGAVGKLADGTVAFTLTVNPATGAYSFSQKAPLDHPNAGNPDDALTLGFGFTVRDADGDPASGQLTVVVRDDGPSAGAVSFATESGSAAVSGTLPFAYGADGAGQVELSGAVPTGLSVGGQAVVVTQTGSGAVGKLADGTAVFSFTVDAAGHYAYTQHLALDGTPVLHLGYKAVDFDGDVATGTITIDTGDGKPCVGQGGENVATVDETGGFDTVSGTLAFSFGPDGAGSVNVTSGPVGLTSQGQAVTVTVSAEGAVGKLADGTVAFTLTVNPATGAYSFSQKAPLDHPNAGNPDDALTLGFGFTVRDADGDPASGQLTVVVRDDGPSVSSTSTCVDESCAQDMVGSQEDGIWATATVGSPLVASGTVPFIFGQDGAGSIDLLSGPSGLRHHGQSVSVAVSGNSATGTLADGTLVFTLVVNAVTGAYTYKQYASLDHADHQNPDDVTTLGFNVRVTDADGDSVRSTLTVAVADDGPVVTGVVVVVNQSVVDDGNHLTSLLTATGHVDFCYGADGKGEFSLTAPLTGLYSEGQLIHVSTVGDHLVGKLDSGQTVFTFDVNHETGAYAYTQYGEITQAAGSSGLVNLPLTYQITDADGDSVCNVITIAIGGQAVSVSAAATQSVDASQGVDASQSVDASRYSLVSLESGDGPDLSQVSQQDDAVSQQAYSCAAGEHVDISSVLEGCHGTIEDLAQYVRVADDGHGNTLVQVDYSGTGSNFTDVAVVTGICGVSLDAMVADGSLDVGRFLHS